MMFFDAATPAAVADAAVADGRPTAAIAVVAAACRLPGGVDSLEALAMAVAQRRDVLRPFPAVLHDRAAGPPTAIVGGLLDDVFDFDPQLFGISPREAQCMDPQQRLMLHLAWELFENANLARADYRATPTGVFLGVCDSGYLALARDAVSAGDRMYLPTGNALNAIAGRVAHCFQLAGPAIAIDTACSSSLVAVDLAIQALRSGRCSLAVAGGVNVLLDNDRNQLLADIGMVSRSGACRPFDAAADGYLRAEAAGLVLLKRLDAAEADGDHVLAVIEGASCNHNSLSAGLTVPSGEAQERVMNAALRDAGARSADIDWVEAHGTGTRLGDPIEHGAIVSVLGGDRVTRGGPLHLTSIKSQFGHAEAAAGIVGLLRVVAGLRAGHLPAQMGFEDLNPAIAAPTSGVEVPVRPVALSRTRPRAIVNSFGFSGTNASLVVRARPAARPATIAPLGIACLSARTPETLRDTAAALATRIETDPSLELAEIERALNVGRSPLKYRRAVPAATREALVLGLRRAAPTTASDLVFLLPGQGSQYGGMGRSLHRAFPGFAPVFDDVCARLSRLIGAELRAIMGADDATVLNDSTMLTQCAVFANSYALGRALLELGVKPAAMIGHSVGEIAACALADVWDLDSACDLVAERGRLMQASGPGRMLSVRASAEALRSLIETSGSPVVVACLNDPQQTVVSGGADAIAAFGRYLAEHKIAAVTLPVNHAFHSPLMRGAADAFAAFASSRPARAATCRIVSTLTGAPLTRADMTGDYWRAQMLGAVDLVGAIDGLVSGAPMTFVEVGANSIVSGCAARILGAGGHRFVHWERPHRHAEGAIALALGQLFESGADLDWRRIHGGAPIGQGWAPLPNSMFETAPCLPAGLRMASPSSTAIAYTRSPATPTRSAEHELSLRTHAYLRDHVVFGKLVAPGAMHCVAALDAIRGCLEKADADAIADVQFVEAAVCQADTVRRLHVSLTARDGAPTQIRSLSFRNADGGFEDVITHATCERADPVDWSQASLLAKEIDAGLTGAIDATSGDDFYRGMRDLAQLNLGPSFRWVRGVVHAHRYARAEFQRDPACGASPFAVDPGLVDACFQTIGALRHLGETRPATFVPFAVRRLTARRALSGERFTCHVRLDDADADADSFGGDAVLTDGDGMPVLLVEGLVVRRATSNQLLRQHDAATDVLFEYAFEPSSDISVPRAARDQAPAQRRPMRTADVAGARRHALILEAAATKLAALALAGRAASAGPLGRRLAEAASPAASTSASAIDAVAEPAIAAICAESTSIGSLLDRLRRHCPELAPEWRLLGHCAPAVGDVLDGRVSGLDVLFPDGDGALVEDLYRDSVLSNGINARLAAIVLDAAERLAPDRPVRILEVGGGTGGTTRYLLDALAGRDHHYVFTDVGPSLVQRAAERFARANVHFAVLDLETDPVEQGFDAADFDIVVAANVIHATRDIDVALRSVNRLLRFGGEVVMLEGNGRQTWLDLTFGLTDGWWHFTDARRAAGYALLDAAGWRHALEETGFAPTSIADDEAALAQVVYQGCKTRVPAAARWLLMGTAVGPVEALARLLRASGGEAIVLAGDPRREATQAHASQAVADAAGDGRPFHLLHLDVASDAEVASVEALVDEAMARARLLPAVMRIAEQALTAGARSLTYLRHALDDAHASAAPEAAALKVLSFETRLMQSRPGRVRFVAADDLEQLMREAVSGRTHPYVRHAEGRRLERVLRPCDAARADSAWAPEAGESALIAGSNAPLALATARWFARRGVRRLVLLSRADQRDADGWNALAGEHGLTIGFHRCDILDASAVAGVVASARADGHRIGTLAHLAGVLDNRLIGDQRPDEESGVVATKVVGLGNLLAAFGDAPPRRVLLYSSAAAAIGSPGQLNHALACATLDLIASRLNGWGVETLSIGWGPWDGIGAAARDERMRQANDWGIEAFSPEAGEALTQRLLDAGPSHLVALRVDWRRFADATGAIFVNAETRALSRDPARRADAPLVELPSAASLATLDAADRRRLLEYAIAALLGAALGLNAPVSGGDRIHDLGMDSLVAIELRSRLKSAYSIDVPAKLFLDNLSVGELAAYVLEGIAAADAAPMFAEGEI